MEAKVYLAKAENSLKAAQLCFENGLYDDAASRAYSCVLKAAIALLIKIGFKADVKRIHKWAQATFPRECVNRSKIIPRRFGGYLAYLQNERITADYAPRNLSKKSVKLALKKANEFLETIMVEFKNE